MDFSQSTPGTFLPVDALPPRSVLAAMAVTWQWPTLPRLAKPQFPLIPSNQASQPLSGSARKMLIPCWSGWQSLLCLRNLISALRTTGLLPNYTAEHHMIHVSSSPARSAPSWLVWHNKPEWKWLAGCNQGRPLGSTITEHGARRDAAGALLNHCSPALQHRKLHFKTHRLGCSRISQWRLEEDGEPGLSTLQMHF